MADSTQPTTVPPPSAQLEEFIFHPDQFRMYDVPRRISPADVDGFVRDRVDQSSKPQAWLQTERVVDFHDVYELCDHITGVLGHRPVDSDERIRSMVCTRILARLGSAADRKVAQKSYEYLAARSKSIAELESLILVYEAFGPDGDPAPTRQALESSLKDLEQFRDTDSPRAGEYGRVETLLTAKLPRVQGADAVKKRVLEITSRPLRIDEEVNYYVGLKPDYPDYMPSWAARRLRREVWADAPAQQLTRVESRRRQEEIVEAFRKALGSIDGRPHLSETEKEFLQITCLRGITYFNGTLTAEEQEVLNTKGQQQGNILSGV